jgi:heme exporter protein D
MIDLGPYADYIVWSYAGVAMMVALAVVWVVWQSRQVKLLLRSLEERGIKRRSERA